MAETTETTTEPVGDETFIDSDTFIDTELVKMLTPEKEVEVEGELSEETTEEVEEKPELEAEESEDPEVEEDEEVSEDSKGVQKRINKAVRKQKEAEEREKALEIRIKKLESGEKPSARNNIDKIAESFDSDELDSMEDQAHKAIDFCLDNPSGFIGDDGKELSAEEITQHKATARKSLEDIRSRRKVIEEADKHTTEIESTYPALRDPDSDVSKGVSNVFDVVPSLKSHPRSKELAIMLILGEQALLKQAEPAKKTAKIGKKKEAKVEKAPSLGSPEEKAGLSNPKNTDGASDETLAKIAEGDDNALINELRKLF